MQIYIWYGTLNQNISDGPLYLRWFWNLSNTEIQYRNANIANFVYYGKTLLDLSSNFLLNILPLHFQMTKLMVITLLVVLVLSIVQAANVDRKGKFIFLNFLQTYQTLYSHICSLFFYSHYYVSKYNIKSEWM